MATLEEAVVASLFEQSDSIADEITYHIPLLKALEDEGNIRRFSGGYELRKPVLYNATAQGGFYSGFSSFSLDAIDDMTAFQFNVRQCYEPLSISGRDKRANRDQQQLLDVVEGKMKATIARLRNTVDVSLRGDGTGSGGLEFDGIKKMVSSSPSSGTYGKITRSGNTWAQNVAVTGVTFTAANIQENLTDAISRVTRGADMPTLGIMDRATWKLLHSSMTAIQRIALPTKTGNAGFRTLEYDGASFVFDGGYGSSVLETNTCRLINPKYVTFDLCRGADFKPLAPEMVRPADQDASFTVVIAEGNLCCSAPALNVYVGT